RSCSGIASFTRSDSVQGDGPATFPDADPVEGAVQRIQRIEQRLGLGFTPVAPQAFGHFVQCQNGAFDVGCTGGVLRGWWFFRHSRFLGGRQTTIPPRRRAIQPEVSPISSECCLISEPPQSTPPR